jgi:threonine synthase
VDLAGNALSNVANSDRKDTGPGPTSPAYAPRGMGRVLECSVDGRQLALTPATWRCPCGAPLDLTAAPPLDPERVDSDDTSIWRWAHTFGLVDERVWPRITLGEGGTPLVPLDANRPHLLAKLDFLMPTLSFKDRGAAVLVALAKSLRVSHLVADSSGNAGTATAAYAARAGLPVRVFVPADTSAGKVAQMRAHGATVESVAGTRQDAAAAAIAAVTADPDAFYASHAWHPAFLEGTKTFAFEVWQQLGRRAPDDLVLPAGNGTLLLGAARGFAELEQAGLIPASPRLIAVQAAACAPLAQAWADGATEPRPVEALPTMAEGIAIAEPPRGRQILSAVASSGGRVLAVDEDAIAAAGTTLARSGAYVEPTAAATYAGVVAHLAQEPGDRLVVFALCGAGLKTVSR